MSFKDIEIKTEYRSGKSNVIGDFYIPVLSHAVKYQRAVGFFSSTLRKRSRKRFIQIFNKEERLMFTSDIYVRGKYASWLKFLSEKTEKNDKSEKVAGVFKRDIDVYLTAAIVGLNFGLRRGADNSPDKAKIHVDTVLKEQDNLTFVFRIAMLVDNSTGLSADEKINRTFKTPDTPENMELFSSYVRGGIEWLYEQFTERATTKDDYLARIYEIVDYFNGELII